MKFLLLLGFSLVHFASQAQSNDHIIYLDSLERPTSKETAEFTRVLVDFFDKPAHCKVNDFYISGARRMTGAYLDKHKRSKTGQFLSYYENGQLKSQLTYENDIPVGRCYFWYENGKKKAECEYDSQRGQDEPTLRINHYWSRIGIHRVVDGKGRFTDEDETSFSEGELKNGIKEGEWWGTDYSDNFTFVENYRKGRLTTGISTDSLGKKHVYLNTFISAAPKNGYEHFDQYFDAEIEKHPEIRQYAKGTIDITFKIQSDGKIVDLKTPGEENPRIGEILQDIFMRYGPWYPARSRGIYTNTYVTVPIPIR